MVGAGPVGLAVALGVARRGRRVVVLEKEPGTSAHSRAPAVWPRTQEILAELGVVDRCLRRGSVVRRLTVHDADTGRRLLTLPLAELADETPYPQLLVLPQSETERILSEALRRESGARILFGTEVTGISQGRAGVRLTYRGDEGTGTLRAAFAAGCDGAHSTVRKALGADFDGITYRTRAALADVAPGSEVEAPSPRLTTRTGLAVAIRIGEGLWRLILPFPDDDPTPLERRVDRAVDALLTPDGYETIWQSEFRLHRRVSSRFVRGRIALAGDAAHLNSPVGGQGMNAGIQDGWSLVSALLRALEGDGPQSLIAYEAERRRAIEGGVNPFTDRLTRLLFFADGAMVKPTFRAAHAVLRLPPLRRRFLRRMAMLERS